MDSHPCRYPGTRWQLIYGAYRDIEEFAVNEAQRLIQRYQPYVVAVHAASAFEPAREEHLFLVGRREDHRWIDDLARQNLISLPSRKESYTIACLDAPWKPAKRLIVIAGADSKGVLNGVADFGAKALSKCAAPEVNAGLRKSFDDLPDTVIRGEPVLENRGIWTWGYVIYDYQRFLDNMARLKMNMLVVWNDVAPLNLRTIVDYAHARGIRIICGFHWGWGLDKVSLASATDRERIKQQVFRHYEDHYREAGIDGIYFQTLTEHQQTTLEGHSTAYWACEWVNDIGRALLAKYPDLYIQFGLHAVSIVEQYRDLQPLDERIAVIWEDAGVTPYSYRPTLECPADSHLARHGLGTFDGTLAYSKKLAEFRPHSEFGLCPKGFSNLSWPLEFEHHGPFIMGERSPQAVRSRYEEKRMWLDNSDQLWMSCFSQAARFYREVRAAARAPMTAVALVEDAIFEHSIPLSVALYAETIWNPHQTDNRLLETAMAHYYRVS